MWTHTYGWINALLAVPLWSVLIGAILGSLIGAAISWRFARASSKEMHAEIARLERSTSVLARLITLVGKGQAPDVNMDPDGTVRGVIHNADLSDSLRGSATIVGGTLEPTKPGDPV
jgi:hypothetical protein